MSAYYNENDKAAAARLRALIAAGHVAPGVVDERDILDIVPSDLDGFTQHHFFAGIGIWSYALRLAGWPDDIPVWTGSCPCQPFSQAGEGAGFADERHLWPAWFHLIQQQRPAVVFGEQVVSPAASLWADLVQDDMEAMGYAFGAVPFPAASVGAPHGRHRIFWVAYDEGGGLRERRREMVTRQIRHSNSGVTAGFLGNPGGIGRQGGCNPAYGARPYRAWRPTNYAGDAGAAGLGNNGGLGTPDSFWSDADWVFCRDGKRRPIEPGAFPLAHGASSRVGRLRQYGNGICAQQAQVFIETAMDVIFGV